ncbi:MAG: type VII secretion protein EccB [Pseudonocardiales bacterium]|nr:type VII secretion protein EccB [Pseudonocardiales bacterium]MBV9032347.1 type VII secretion protein EccB [Pseudonocardiales bacterium]MBW0008897.1 type VII secretion protein EccB [Pseudonocardiales bacterium]
MSTNPATKSQVQAYRFVLRRMESALVRKDAVMLHEPMRHHLRAMAVGLILGLAGLAAFLVLGKLS